MGVIQAAGGVLVELQWRAHLDGAAVEQPLQVFPKDQMAEHPVSTLVNKVANNLPECIEPLDTPAAQQ